MPVSALFKLEGNSTGFRQAISSVKSGINSFNSTIDKIKANTGSWEEKVLSTRESTIKFKKSINNAQPSVTRLSRSIQTAGVSTNNFKTSMSGMIGVVFRAASVISRLQTDMLGIQAAIKSFSVLSGTAKQFSSFEEGLLSVQALSRSTDAEMVKLRGLFENLAFKTPFSNQDILQGAANLASLGVKGEEAFNKLLPKVTELAIATDRDMASSAELLLKTMQQSGKSMEEAGFVVDVISNAYSKSAANAEKFAVAMQFAGFAGSNMGQSLEDTTAIVAALIDRGLDASIAGTQLRSVYATLSTQTRKLDKSLEGTGLTFADVDTNTNRFIDVLEKLKNAQLEVSTINSLFGKQAAPVVNKLIDIEIGGQRGAEALRTFSKGMAESGSAAKNMEIKSRGLGFSFKQVSAGAGILSVKIGEVLAKATGLEDISKNIANRFQGLAESLEKINPDIFERFPKEIFSPVNIASNLEAAFSRVLPQAVKFFGTAGLTAATSILEPIAANLPKIFGMAGSVAIKLLFAGAGAIADMLLSYVGEMSKFINNAVANIQQMIGDSIKNIPGFGGIGKGMIDSAKGLREGALGVDPFIKELREKTSNLFAGGGALAAEGFEELVKTIDISTNASKELADSIRLFANERGLNSDNVRRQGRFLFNEVTNIATQQQKDAVIVNDNSVNVNYRQPSRKLQIAQVESRNPRAVR